MDVELIVILLNADLILNSSFCNGEPMKFNHLVPCFLVLIVVQISVKV